VKLLRADEDDCIVNKATWLAEPSKTLEQQLLLASPEVLTSPKGPARRNSLTESPKQEVGVLASLNG
jgi:hypothetical protein